MSSVLQNYSTSKHHIFLMMGMLLCAYFLYHSFHGQRSYPNLLSLRDSVGVLQSELDALKGERSILERQVVMLRPGSIDPDMLEERARLVLGYKSADELIILSE